MTQIETTERSFTEDTYDRGSSVKSSEHKLQQPQPLEPNTDGLKCVAAVVMPAGTGKSHFRRIFPELEVVEADELCHPRETEELSTLRTHAKETGEWKDYDDCLSRELLNRIKPGGVIMVACEELAQAMDANILGVFVLERHAWERNMSSRGQLTDKHLAHYEKVSASSSAVKYPNGAALFCAVINTIGDWYEGYEY